MADVATTPAGADAPAHKTRPEKPDEAKYKEDLGKAEKEHAVVQEQLNKIKAKIQSGGPPNKESPIYKKQQELRAELSTIRQQQSGFKSSRNSQQEKIASLESQVKSRIAEQKTARSRVSFKNVEEVDREIAHLEKQVDSGTMKLVDEKKALSEISSLRKQRKGFAGFDEAQKEIDDVKSKISELKKERDNPEEKALREKYSSIQKELDDIKAEHDEAYKSLNSLRDERTRLQQEQNEKYSVIRAIKDTYYKGKREFKEFEDQLWKAKKERSKAEREAWEKEKRRKVADKKMEEAQNPAYTDEILTAEGLIRYFDPSSAVASTVIGPSKFAAQAQRTIDDSGVKGMKVLKKDDQEENYFMGTGGKKGKKGKKGGAPATSTAPEGGKFNINLGVIEELAKVGVEPPATQSDVPSVVEKLKEKLETWKKDQASKTQENIDKAQKEIDRLEKEALEASSTSPPPKSDKTHSHNHGKKAEEANEGVNGNVSAEAELPQEEDAAADVVEDLKEASLEDKAE